MNRIRSLLPYQAAVAAALLFAAGCEQPGGLSEQSGAALTADQVFPTGGVCTPTGAHAKHAAVTGCATCHACGGGLQFDAAGAAVIPGAPPPSFDPVSKSCSSVACHRVPPGTFSYYFPGGDGEPELNTVTYGSTTGRTTPSWYATGALACTACHDDPPRNGSSGSNAWHSGNHGNEGPTGKRNQCQFCHPDASSPGNGIGDTITNPSLHANGVVNVQASFTSACFGCH